MRLLRPQWLRWARKWPSLRRSGRQGGTSPPVNRGPGDTAAVGGPGTQTCLPAPQLSGFQELVGGSAAPPCALATSWTLTSDGQSLCPDQHPGVLKPWSEGPRGPAGFTPSLPPLRGWVLEHWVRLQLDTSTGWGGCQGQNQAPPPLPCAGSGPVPPGPCPPSDSGTRAPSRPPTLRGFQGQRMGAAQCGACGPKP